MSRKTKSATPVAAPASQSYLRLSAGQCPKLGQRAEGLIHFELLASMDRQQLFIRLVSNDSGGYFGREPVDFARIRAVADAQEADKPFNGRVFGGGLFKSQSANNGGFMTAALRSLGLLVAGEKSNLSMVTGDWSAFAQAQLSLAGETIQIDPPAPRGKPRKVADAVPGTAVPETGGADGDPAAVSDDPLASAADNEVAEVEMPLASESPVADEIVETPEMAAAVDADEAHAEIKIGRKQRRRQEAEAADAHSA
jgi:hypothetical protein